MCVVCCLINLSYFCPFVAHTIMSIVVVLSPLCFFLNYCRLSVCEEYSFSAEPFFQTTYTFTSTVFNGSLNNVVWEKIGFF